MAHTRPSMILFIWFGIWIIQFCVPCHLFQLATTTIRPYDSFDQIDDDFPFEKNAPNTRTYWRPGARTALSFCSFFAIQHVYTTAQGTYTANVLKELKKNHHRTTNVRFHTVIHRDISPASIQQGKDLSLILAEAVPVLTTATAAATTATADRESSCPTTTTTYSSSSTASSLMNRIVLLDDRVKNFAPQNGQNGLHVFPFQVMEKVQILNNDENNNNENNNNNNIIRIDTVQEIKEVARFVGISLLCLFATDVCNVLSYFQSPQHKECYLTTPPQHPASLA